MYHFYLGSYNWGQCRWKFVKVCRIVMWTSICKRYHLNMNPACSACLCVNEWVRFRLLHTYWSARDARDIYRASAFSLNEDLNTWTTFPELGMLDYDKNHTHNYFGQYCKSRLFNTIMSNNLITEQCDNFEWMICLKIVIAIKYIFSVNNVAMKSTFLRPACQISQFSISYQNTRVTNISKKNKKKQVL